MIEEIEVLDFVHTCAYYLCTGIIKVMEVSSHGNKLGKQNGA